MLVTAKQPSLLDYSIFWEILDEEMLIKTKLKNLNSSDMLCNALFSKECLIQKTIYRRTPKHKWVNRTGVAGDRVHYVGRPGLTAFAYKAHSKLNGIQVHVNTRV